MPQRGETLQQLERGIGHAVARLRREPAGVGEAWFVAAPGKGLQRRRVAVPAVGQGGDERVREG